MQKSACKILIWGLLMLLIVLLLTYFKVLPQHWGITQSANKVNHKAADLVSMPSNNHNNSPKNKVVYQIVSPHGDIVFSDIEPKTGHYKKITIDESKLNTYAKKEAHIEWADEDKTNNADEQPMPPPGDFVAYIREENKRTQEKLAEHKEKLMDQAIGH